MQRVFQFIRLMNPLSFEFANFLIFFLDGILNAVLKSLAGFVEKGSDLHLGAMFKSDLFLLQAPDVLVALGKHLQMEIASLLDKSRQALKDSVQDAVEEKN